jgi:Cu-Zn family superoxide dismutase
MRIAPKSIVLATATATLASMVLAGCASAPPPAESPPADVAMPTASSVAGAVVNLSAASGSLVSGRLTLRPMGDGIHLNGEIGGLPPGSSHGFHIHETGDCSAADATSAGGHFNPGGEPHGRATQAQHHAGDADNIVADAEGVATVDAHFSGVVLGGNGANDAIGKAVIVHADPDDYRSQPSGNAGARVACGVIEAAP